jgi:hypothetical protein
MIALPLPVAQVAPASLGHALCTCLMPLLWLRSVVAVGPSALICLAMQIKLPASPQVFATPKRHHKSKPFFDHIISFTMSDGRLWLRNYQVGSAINCHPITRCQGC